MCLTSLIIREVEIKTTARMTIIKKHMNNKCWRECGERETLLHCCWECKLVQPLQRTVWRCLKNLKNRELPYDLLQASQVALVVKNLPANAGDNRDGGLIPVSGRSPGGGYGNPTPVFLPGESHEQRSLVGYTP